jgi:hypothetical protein
VAIPVMLFFLSSDLGTVDQTIHAQTLHNPMAASKWNSL